MQQPEERAAAPLDFTEAVHDLARRIPAGRVLGYGDIAELLGTGGARQVGRAMQGTDPTVPWWRVIRADGTITATLRPAAESAWNAEDTPRRGARVDMARARWQPDDTAWRRIDALAAGLRASQTSVANDEMEP